ncbi:MAG: hypothetical protein LBT98_01230, partial [Puniceicoccales bacterium]|nr:hypothetical protein [Puniceicoccales bacterium]
MIGKRPAIDGIHGAVSCFCKENSLDFEKKVGRPPRLTFVEVLTIFISFLLSRRKDFAAFYFGSDGDLCRTFFPHMTCYSAFLRRLPIVGEILSKFL